jgi:hypothetical protein
MLPRKNLKTFIRMTFFIIGIHRIQLLLDPFDVKSLSVNVLVKSIEQFLILFHSDLYFFYKH